MRLLFLIVFIGLNAFSQKINLGDLRGFQNSSLDTLKEELKVYTDDYMLTVNLNTFEKSLTPLYLEPGLSPGSKYLTYTPIRLKDSIYFVSSSGGMVYTIINDTVKRIDKSFDHGMQYGTNIFQHKGTVYKYGGYGFWSNRDFFTYYDTNQDEWEVNHPISSDVTPKGRADYFSIKDKNHFHVFGGITVNPHNRRQQLNNNEVWTFDFDTATWHFLGKHDEIEKSDVRIPFKDKLILVRLNHMTMIDIQNNRKTIFNNSPVSAQINGIRYATYAKGKFYIILGNSTGTYLNIVDEKDFFGSKIEEQKFYKNQGYWLIRGAILIFILVAISLLFWVIKKKFVVRNKIKLLDNGLRYHLKFTEFDPDSMEIIRLLLNNDEVTSSMILQIVEKEQYSPAHNERIKVQKVSDINIKIATLLGIKHDLIISFKSTKDRRIRLYKISKEYFNLR